MISQLVDDMFVLVCDYLTPKEIGALNCTSKVLNQKVQNLKIIWFSLYKRLAESGKEGYGKEHLAPRDSTCFLMYEFYNKEHILYGWINIKKHIPDFPYLHQEKHDKRKYIDFYHSSLQQLGIKEQVEQLAQNHDCSNILHHNKTCVFNTNKDYVKLYKKLVMKRFGFETFTIQDEKELRKLEEQIKKGKGKKLESWIERRNFLLKKKRMIQLF